ncbi:dihydroorotate dehydrogenase (quinone) [Litorimonas cladophorae]|uniref:Dihydroorotate dehydrogenase (quinone) n=1 Tax=Litorimonas cladophorae TaxID=1220491 RepID=A0A918KLL9_9PROT|nr:quinone-dependent dihydroorotate dehydrogenase [Litorimonas cladophorae]GGX68549.1 dihydroorotate dehydrogenase (quinone) [Litorimonas cladophorae]
MSLLYKSGTALLRRLPAERAHVTTVKLLRAGLGPKTGEITSDILKTTVGGLNLPNPVGLAAGFDKDCDVPDAMLNAGFGFVECGTVTPRPQIGNPQPRLFRLVEDEAVINRMGFNNRGLDHFSERLRARKGNAGIVGANLGANKDSDDRPADYVAGLSRLWGHADYFTINISSPNTPGLRQLQGADEMEDLLGRIAETRAALTGNEPSVPIFLKVAPDVDSGQIGRIVEQARTYGMNAIIVSNTTLDRPESLQSAHHGEGGGLSGQPLFEKSTRVLSEFADAADGSIDLIGVGGIGSGAQAYAKIRAGAKAVQLYSALVYHGPQLVAQICADLEARAKADGFKTIGQAVGADLT